MNINRLRYFVAAAETGSFTKAAEQYYISQTAITQQIRLLEEELGCELFSRSKRPVMLTDAGRTFLLEAKAVIARMDLAVEKTRNAASGLSGNLRVGYLKGYERSRLSQHLRELHAAAPNITISCFRNSADGLTAGLFGGDYDIIFTWDSVNLLSDANVASQLYETVPLMVALYPSHPLTQKKSLKRSDLKNEKLLYLSLSENAESSGDAHYIRLYSKAGFRPDILFRSSDMESVLMMTSAEQGIAILPSYCTEKLTNADNLVFRPLKGSEEKENIYALWLKSRDSRARDMLLSLIKKEPD